MEKFFVGNVCQTEIAKNYEPEEQTEEAYGAIENVTADVGGGLTRSSAPVGGVWGRNPDSYGQNFGPICSETGVPVNKWVANSAPDPSILALSGLRL